MDGREHEERQPDATSAGLLLDLLYCERQSQSPSDVTPDSDTATEAGHQIKGRAATAELAAAKSTSGTTGEAASTQARDELADRWNEEAEAEDSEGAKDTPGSSTDLCPLCMRRCEDHHRLGKFWQKFGYSGPPYCTRCSSVFRAHLVTRLVAQSTCSRESPCARCAKVLHHFALPSAEAFRRMDVSAAALHKVTAQGVGEAVTGNQRQREVCPHCGTEDTRGLGLSWRKFGYAGPAYCKSCSASFRNHIIRQRGGKKQQQIGCCRAKPCRVCTQILSFFPSNQGESDLEQIYSLFDKKKRAPNVIPLNSRRPPVLANGRSNNGAQQSTRHPSRQLEKAPCTAQQKRMKRTNGQQRKDLKTVQPIGHSIHLNGAMAEDKLSTAEVLQQQAHQRQAQQLHHDMQQHLLLQLHQQYQLLQQQIQQSQQQQIPQQPGPLGTGQLLASAAQGSAMNGDSRVLTSPVQLQHAVMELQRIQSFPLADHFAQFRPSRSMQY